MNIIFEIGIIIVGLGLIKWILFAISMLFSQRLPIYSQKANFAIKVVSYYLICSLVAAQLHENAAVFNGKWPWLLALITLFLYFLGKFENRNNVRIQINQFNNIKQEELPPKLELFLVSGCLIYFLATMIFPGVVAFKIFQNLNLFIHHLSETFLIGWLVKIVAFFFLIQTVFTGLNQINRLVFGLSKKNTTQNNKKDDEFDDYEEIE